ncbi:MAG TPA: hypothetical protein PKL08_16315 [Thermoanaerobaculaceae bacterium]|nr:hypothetical protein [Thermoanaerobaculaceae bacterium]
MARKTGLRTGEVTVVREATALLAADSAVLTDANIPPSGIVDCSGYDTVLVGVDIFGGASPTMTVEALFYDPEAADGGRWKRLLLGSSPGVTPGAAANETTGALAPNANMVELRVFGSRQVFFRISAVANPGSTTGWKILAMPGKVRGDRALSRYSP